MKDHVVAEKGWDTRLTVIRTPAHTRVAQNLGEYEIRLGGKWDWDSILLGRIAKGYRKGTSNIGGGVLGDRHDFWVTPSKLKMRLKTLRDFACMTGGERIALDEDNNIYAGSGGLYVRIAEARATYKFEDMGPPGGKESLRFAECD